MRSQNYEDAKYVQTKTTPFRVEGWDSPGGKWWVVARNGRIVADCYAERTAQRIARLLNEDSRPS